MRITGNWRKIAQPGQIARQPIPSDRGKTQEAESRRSSVGVRACKRSLFDPSHPADAFSARRRRNPDTFALTALADAMLGFPCAEDRTSAITSRRTGGSFDLNQCISHPRWLNVAAEIDVSPNCRTLGKPSRRSGPCIAAKPTRLCPLWIRLRHSAVPVQCPVCTKADLHLRSCDVADVPIAALSRWQQTARLFDHLVGAGEERRRHFQAKRPRSLAARPEDRRVSSAKSCRPSRQARAGSAKSIKPTEPTGPRIPISRNRHTRCRLLCPMRP